MWQHGEPKQLGYIGSQPESKKPKFRSEHIEEES